MARVIDLVERYSDADAATIMQVSAAAVARYVPQREIHAPRTARMERRLRVVLEPRRGRPHRVRSTIDVTVDDLDTRTSVHDTAFDWAHAVGCDGGAR